MFIPPEIQHTQQDDWLLAPGTADPRVWLSEKRSALATGSRRRWSCWLVGRYIRSSRLYAAPKICQLSAAARPSRLHSTRGMPKQASPQAGSPARSQRPVVLNRSIEKASILRFSACDPITDRRVTTNQRRKKSRRSRPMAKVSKGPAKAASKVGAASGSAHSTTPAAAAAAASPSPPSWPPFKPSLPVVDPLAFESVVPAKVVVARSFFPRSLCRTYVDFLASLPLTTTPARPKRGEAVRQNDRFQVHDPVFASRLWRDTGLRDALLLAGAEEGHDDTVLDPRLWGGEVVGLNPNIRVYRYTKGQHFAPHYDDSNNVAVTAEDGKTSIPAKTTWTLLLYLTSTADGGCAGGETVFYTRDRVSAKEEVAVAPEAGLLLLHKHGDDCMLHEGREVTAGEKWVIRSDLCVRK
ncbi:hypothetical protein MAPG_02341 [Magnaporthiopsis poae ATCC 64411]|uniref:Fe2OG dioxygenase domain-containing protein n=1 Tax=Magnaporthiopsis poae (strain ATCC 64411 / 73-15) TaxID=644358 RepID=A0A0C4DR40_MAGP6|nr:hypothetical protein MAPG_02341 [Magnaporthiopsis poae ATCC 64411]